MKNKDVLKGWKTKSSGPNFIMYMLDDEPSSIKEVISALAAPFWEEVVNSEIESIMENST